ncbi:metallophosphoesterase [Pseudomonas mosselii]|uniref:metallophosphoesterase n=1 Tax=Pseudomonas mosselii TaxID=78327 RepID=UPI0021DB3A76|nr:metallophosphoesterase [Pseudomonas mosselii]MCU9531121.1 metallophosphoesterase [Pseudomonas mosselii]MCU9538065.1 metallophosphoesterase [Pseudomonas mosselii]MCU9544092.1 metallophosphoesterase [Pseudomonas mosselii]MCU9549869.1 metallophosphoesterase [Pseudomonas mosselii]
MRFLHISDLHITHSSDHSRTVEALCSDIKKANTAKEVNAIFCTGDIANRGDTSPEAIELQASILKKITESAPGATFICCPGNHDINLKIRDEIYSPIFTSIKSPDEANKLVEKLIQKGRSDIWSHLDGYIELSRKISPHSYSNNILFTTKTLELNGISVGIASLNSTWRTFGGGAKDQNNLYVGERQVELALEEIKSCDLKIALMHHTLDWLAQDEKGRIQRVLADNFDAMLCGHNHKNNATNNISTLGSLLISNTGCIYETREHYNGYSILDIDTTKKECRIEAREYYHERNSFDLSPRFSEGGAYIFSLQKNNNTPRTSISNTAINAALEKANSKLLSFSASDIAPKHLSSIFVEPPLARKSEKNLVAQKNVKKRNENEFVNLNSLSQEKIDILFVGKRESGKSTLLNHIAVNMFMEFHGNARIGLLIDLSTLSKLTTASILTQAIEFLDNEITKKDLISLLENGEALVILDSFNIHNPQHRRVVEELREKYPQPRYVLATNEEVQDDLSLGNLPELKNNPTTIYIHSFKRKQTKELVSKWFGDHEQHSEEKFTLIKKLLQRLNVPETPFLVSVLLWVLEQQPSAKLINQASAIEALIFGLLEKFTESKSRSNYDSNIQSHFLTELATTMDEDNIECIDSNDFELFVSSYFKKRGLAVPSRGFTDELLRKGLLYESNQKITFKFDCFRAFFLANKLAENNEILKKILTPERIAKYTTELDLLTGLHRDRKEILTLAKNCCAHLLPASEFEVELSLFEAHGKVKGIFNQEETLTKIEDDILNSTLDENDRARYIEDAEVPSKASVDHDHARARQATTPLSNQMHFIGALKVYSNILRNSELIDDVDLKKTCLNDVLTLWAKIIVSTTDFLNNTSLEDLPEEFPARFGALNAEQFRDFVRLMMPQLVSSLMAESLATPKLESFIIEETSNESQCIRFLATMLSIENLNKQSIQATQKLLKENGSNNIVLQAVFIRLLTLYYFEAPTTSLAALKECIGDAFSALRGGTTSQERTIIKGKFLQHIDDNRPNTIDDLEI